MYAYPSPSPSPRRRRAELAAAAALGASLAAALVLWLAPPRAGQPEPDTRAALRTEGAAGGGGLGLWSLDACVRAAQHRDAAHYFIQADQSLALARGEALAEALVAASGTSRELVIARAARPHGAEFLVAVHGTQRDEWLSAEVINRGEVEGPILDLLEAQARYLLDAESDADGTEAGQRALHVVDVGANIGFMSLFLAALSPRVYVTAVEPTPWHYELLELSLRLNPHLAQRIRLFRTGLGAAGLNRGASLCMRADPKNGASTVATGGKCPRGRGGVTVPVRTLDDVLAASWDLPVDILKMDVEGYEPMVCDGATELLATSPSLIVSEYIPFRVMAAMGLNSSQAAFDAFFAHFPPARYNASIVYYQKHADASPQQSREILRGWDADNDGGDVVLRPLSQ